MRDILPQKFLTTGIPLSLVYSQTKTSVSLDLAHLPERQKICPKSFSTSLITGCEFSGMQKLLAVAWCTSSAVDESGVVRKIHGTPRQREGWKAHDHCMFCSCTPEVYQPPRYGFSLDFSDI
jgi:hypothetical protein